MNSLFKTWKTIKIGDPIFEFRTMPGNNIVLYIWSFKQRKKVLNKQFIFVGSRIVENEYRLIDHSFRIDISNIDNTIAIDEDCTYFCDSEQALTHIKKILIRETEIFNDLITRYSNNINLIKQFL